MDMYVAPMGALKRVAKVFVALFAVLGGLSFVFLLPKLLVETFGLSPVWRIALGVVSFAIFLVAFVGAWVREWIRDFVHDRPFPGFSQDYADALRVIARRILPELPDRRRNPLVMAAGLCGAGVVLHALAKLLSYFTERYRVLARELHHEVEFRPDAVKALASNAQDLFQDVRVFRQVMQDWAKDTVTLPHLAGVTITARLESAEQALRHVTRELDRVHTIVLPFDEQQLLEKRAELIKEFDLLRQDVIQYETDLTHLLAQLRECHQECRKMADGLPSR